MAKQDKRVLNTGPWPPGKSGNLAGRPKKGTALADILHEYLDKGEKTKTRKQLLVEKLYAIAMEGDVTAIKFILHNQKLLLYVAWYSIICITIADK